MFILLHGKLEHFIKSIKLENVFFSSGYFWSIQISAQFGCITDARMGDFVIQLLGIVLASPVILETSVKQRCCFFVSLLLMTCI